MFQKIRIVLLIHIQINFTTVHLSLQGLFAAFCSNHYPLLTKNCPFFTILSNAVSRFYIISHTVVFSAGFRKNIGKHGDFPCEKLETFPFLSAAIFDISAYYCRFSHHDSKCFFGLSLPVLPCRSIPSAVFRNNTFSPAPARRRQSRKNTLSPTKNTSFQKNPCCLPLRESCTCTCSCTCSCSCSASFASICFLFLKSRKIPPKSPGKITAKSRNLRLFSENPLEKTYGI